MRKTLLSIVQSVLSDMNADEVNSISDTAEAAQVAQIVEDVFYSTVIERNFPEHNRLQRLVPSSDSGRPTHFTVPAVVRNISSVEYDVSPDNSGDYRLLQFLDKISFLQMCRPNSDRNVLVLDTDGLTKFHIRDTVAPTYYTVLSDREIVLDAYDKTIGLTALGTRTRVFAQILPEFEQVDDYILDIDDSVIPLIVADAKSSAFAILLDKPNPIAERQQRRYRNFLTRDEHLNRPSPNWRNYGRR